jgi:hypothetical protein
MANERRRPNAHWPTDERPPACRAARLAGELPGRASAERAAVRGLAGLLVATATSGSVHAYARAVFYAGFAAWAWEELAGGVNWVRRAIGAAGLVYEVARVGAAL